MYLQNNYRGGDTESCGNTFANVFTAVPFKSKTRGRTLCVCFFKELIIFYVKHESVVPVGLIDASNFERV